VDRATRGAVEREGTIDKTIDCQLTRIMVGSKLDAAVRWKRVLDGIEGHLELDLSAVSSVTPEGAQALVLALRSLGPEVERARVEGCPRLVAEHLLAARPALRAEIASVTLEGRCTPCQAKRPARLQVSAIAEVLGQDGDPYAPCRRCNTPISFAESRSFLRQVAGLD